MNIIFNLITENENSMNEHNIDESGCESCEYEESNFDYTISQDDSINIVNSGYRYGFHVKKETSMIKTFKNVIDYTPLSAMQFYNSNSRSKTPPKFDWVDLKAARNIIETFQEMYVCIHGCLLYNLAGTVNGPSDNKYNYALSSSINGLVDELDFGVVLGRPNNIGIGVVVHPGSRKDRKEGHIQVSKSIIQCLTLEGLNTKGVADSLGITVKEVLSKRKIILENSAGEGTKLCSTLEEIAQVINNIPKHLKPQVKVCIDTMHIFGRGLYDFGIEGEIERFYQDFDDIIGLEYLEVFHFNDAYRSDDKRKNAPFGSRKDRHQNLGAGYIFGGEGKDNKEDLDRLDKITIFIEYALHYKIPMIGEPPNPGIIDWQIVACLTKDTHTPLVY